MQFSIMIQWHDALCIKGKTVTVIARDSTVNSSKHVLIAEGLLLHHHLLRVLESGSGFAKKKVCVVLHSLSFTTENVRAIGSRGGISSLLEICEAGTPNSQTIAAGAINSLRSFWDSATAIRSLEVAVEFFKNIASDELLVEALISYAFLLRIVNVLNYGVLGVRIQSAKAICRLRCNTKERK
ncbi:putative armadillo-like helical protein [Helianthus annuus]|nr:putative armadillo-like helical protein [Helianthus annuus]